MKKNLIARITLSCTLVFSIFLLNFSHGFAQAWETNEMLISFEPTATDFEISTFKSSIGAIEVAVSPLSNVHLWYIPTFSDAYQNYGWININEIVNGSGNKAIVNSTGLNHYSDLPETSIGSPGSSLDPTELCPEFSILSNISDQTVKVAILDTGIGYTGSNSNPVLCNPDLFDPYYMPNNIGFDFVNNDNEPQDDHGHGTHIAGIIAQMARMAGGLDMQLMSFKTHNHLGIANEFDVIQATDRAVLHGANIINMSFSYPAPVNNSTVNNNPTPLQLAIDAAGEQGVLVIASAGNIGAGSSTNTLFYPAGFNSNNIISVASVNCDRELSSFSAWGIPQVDIAMLGEDIQGPHHLTGEMVLKSGTSQASGIVSGIAAQLASNMNIIHYAPLKCSILGSAEYSFHLEGLLLTEGVANAGEAYNILQSGCELSGSPGTLGGSELASMPGAVAGQVSGEILSVFPNPFQHGLALIYQAEQVGEVTFTVSDARGSVLYSEMKMLDEPGNIEFFWSPDQLLAPGLYVTRIHLAGQTITKKVVKD